MQRKRFGSVMENQTEQKVIDENAVRAEHIQEPTGRKKNNWPMIAGAVIILLTAGLIYLMVISDPAVVEKFKDISIVVFVLLSVVICIALIVLIEQLAALTNLMKNEVKPMLKTADDTVHCIKGTVTFMSDNMVQPAIKTNSAVAGVAKIVSILKPGNIQKGK